MIDGKENVGEKFKDYFIYDEVISKVLLYWVFVMLCGCNEGFLMFNINVDLE